MYSCTNYVPIVLYMVCMLLFCFIFSHGPRHVQSCRVPCGDSLTTQVGRLRATLDREYHGKLLHPYRVRMAIPGGHYYYYRYGLGLGLV